MSGDLWGDDIGHRPESTKLWVKITCAVWAVIAFIAAVAALVHTL